MGGKVVLLVLGGWQTECCHISTPCGAKPKRGSENSGMPRASVIFYHNVCKIAADEVIITEHTLLLVWLVKTFSPISIKNTIAGPSSGYVRGCRCFFFSVCFKYGFIFIPAADLIVRTVQKAFLLKGPLRSCPWLFRFNGPFEVNRDCMVHPLWPTILFHQFTL